MKKQVPPGLPEPSHEPALPEAPSIGDGEDKKKVNVLALAAVLLFLLVLLYIYLKERGL